MGKDVDGMKSLEGFVALGHSAAAHCAGLIPADPGARVIKVENPEGGDYFTLSQRDLEFTVLV